MFQSNSDIVWILCFFGLYNLCNILQTVFHLYGNWANNSEINILKEEITTKTMKCKRPFRERNAVINDLFVWLICLQRDRSQIQQEPPKKLKSSKFLRNVRNHDMEWSFNFS